MLPSVVSDRVGTPDNPISRLNSRPACTPIPTLRCALTGRQRMVGATVSRYDFDVGLFHSLLHAGCPALSGNRGYLSTVRQLRLRVVAGRAEGPMERHPLRVRYIAAELARRRG